VRMLCGEPTTWGDWHNIYRRRSVCRASEEQRTAEP
jgi:hypothetical protein